ncbi:MAG: ATP synthase F1 subunit gamma [Terriglobia bacterium]
MPTLIDHRRRIRSVRNTQKITRAMKLVSAAKLRRAQERIFAARPYARMMLAVLRSLALRAEVRTHPLLQTRPEKRFLVLLLSGDKGLCGPFNTNVIRTAQDFLAEHRNGFESELITIGKKGRDFYRRHKQALRAEWINLFLRRVEYSHAREIAARVIELYSKAEIDAVYLIYNEFKSILAQRLMVEKLLPLEGVLPAPSVGRGPARAEGIAVRGGEAITAAPVREGTPPVAGAQVDYIYEQPPLALLSVLLPRHIEVQIFRALLESAAAEQAARMTAMDAATNNAAEMIERLTLEMNKIRQAQITREIIEIVSGAAAL